MDVLTSLNCSGLSVIAEDILLLLDAESLSIAEFVSEDWKEIIITQKIWLKKIRKEVHKDSQWAKVVKYRQYERYLFDLSPEITYEHIFYKMLFYVVSHDIKRFNFDWKLVGNVKSHKGKFPREIKRASHRRHRVIFSLDDGSFVIHDLNTLLLVMVLSDTRYNTPATALLLEDDYVFSGTNNGQVLVWNLVSQSIVAQLGAHVAAITEIVFLNGIMAVASADGYVTVWNSSLALNITLRNVLYVGAEGVNCVVLTPQFIAATANDRVIKVWTEPQNSGEPFRMLRGHGGVVTCLYHFQGYLASGSEDNTIAIWQLSSGTLVRTLVGNTCKLVHVFFDRKLFFSISICGSVKRWKTKNIIGEAFSDRAPIDDVCIASSEYFVSTIPVYINKIRR